MAHKSTEGAGFEDIWGNSQPSDEPLESAPTGSEPVVDASEHDDEHDSHAAKIAMGVGVLGLMGIASAVAYRNLRKHHKEGN